MTKEPNPDYFSGSPDIMVRIDFLVALFYQSDALVEHQCRLLRSSERSEQQKTYINISYHFISILKNKVSAELSLLWASVLVYSSSFYIEPLYGTTYARSLTLLLSFSTEPCRASPCCRIEWLCTPRSSCPISHPSHSRQSFVHPSRHFLAAR